MVAVASALFMVALSAFPAFAAESHSDTISVINTVGLDNIHIEINQYDIKDSLRVPIEENPVVLPAQVINRVCEIKNFANEAWIRAKIVFDEDAPEVSDDFLTIASDKWKKCGDYFYYVESVPHDNTIELFNRINIPADWDNSYAGKSIKFNVFADAVQTQNFTPDFDNEDPWFGTIIEHRVRDAYVVPVEQGNDLFKVIYENGSEGLVKIGDDFFSNWSTLMPGDVVKDKVLIKNNYSIPTSIYFRTNTIDDSKLLDKLVLKIYTEKRVIYNGLMSGGISNDIELVKLKQGEEIELFYELKVPSELTNEFSLTKTKTEWIFKAHSDNMVPPSPDATGYIIPGNSNTSPEIPDGWNGGGGNSTIKTGDVSIMLSISIAAIICIVALFVALSKGGQKNEES